MNIIEYRSIEDMNRLLLENLYKLPRDIDLIVGVPRSGMLPANLLALYLNKPFTDIDSFLEGKIYSSGERGKDLDLTKIHRVLIMDDSISSGFAMNKAKKKIKTVIGKYDLLYGVVFAKTETKDSVDFFCEIIDAPRVFQWNIFHHNLIERSCFDMDGVLCVDPAYDDDGPAYLEYIKNAPPLYIPSVEIDTIVTCRLEKYRKVTEEWLRNNGVKYKQLVMLPYKTKEERVKWGKHGIYKGETIKKSNNLLFFESSKEQAKEINRISGVPVFCTETFTLIDENIAYKRKKLIIKERIKSVLSKILGRYYVNVISFIKHR